MYHEDNHTYRTTLIEGLERAIQSLPHLKQLIEVYDLRA